MYKTILMPVDGSECSTKALAEGLELAKSIGASITLLYALESVAAAFWVSPESVPYGLELIEDLRKAGRGVLEKAQQTSEAAGVSVRTELVEAKPAEAILELSKAHDLIVMGTHGRSGLDRWMLGSVTEAVIHHSTKPVLVIRSKPA
jgi:nucleotide-binding universal stress UspA family protein